MFRYRIEHRSEKEELLQQFFRRCVFRKLDHAFFWIIQVDGEAKMRLHRPAKCDHSLPRLYRFVPGG